MEIEEYYPKLLAFSTLRRFYDARARKQSLYFDMEPGAPPPLYESDSPTTERLPASGATDDRAAADHFGLSRGADETTHSDAEEPPPSFRVRSGTEISDALGVRRPQHQQLWVKLRQKQLWGKLQQKRLQLSLNTAIMRTVSVENRRKVIVGSGTWTKRRRR